MEYKRVWMPYNTSPDLGDGKIVICNPSDNEKTSKAESEIKKLISEGWEIISTAPVIGSMSVNLPHLKYNVSYTTGIEIFLVKK